jgi:putative nucleotidyltransferase with HDIG domain
LLRAAGVWPNIIAHSLAVERFAIKLAKKIKKRGAVVDLALVSRGALLHDLDKVECVECEKRGLGSPEAGHGKRAFKMLSAKGAAFRKIALIARRHVLESVLTPNEAPKSIEEKIVFYADKRVTGVRVVSLKARLDYIMRRYGKTRGARKQIAACEAGSFRIEKELRRLAGAAGGKV